MMSILSTDYPGFLRLVMAFAVFVLFTLTANAGDPEGINLLEKMHLAQDKIDYVGEFVAVKDGKIASFKIAHLSTDVGSRQKLISLDGTMREIIQSEGVIACILPGQGMGVREKKQRKQLFKASISSNIKDVQRYYIVTHLGAERVANRDCEQIKVLPKDGLRYGYLLCIDSEKFLLLSSELSNQEDEVLESYMFTHVKFDAIDNDEFISRTAPQTLQWLEDKPLNFNNNESAKNRKWHVKENESGFALKHYISRVSPVMQANITHLVLGDGMASVSVFISPFEVSAKKQNETINMGGLSSFSRKLDNHMITVIGEVPQATVAMIAANIF